jgi:hypothetical protein
VEKKTRESKKKPRKDEKNEGKEEKGSEKKENYLFSLALTVFPVSFIRKFLSRFAFFTFPLAFVPLFHFLATISQHCDI